MKRILKRLIAKIWSYYVVKTPNALIDFGKMDSIISQNREALKNNPIWITEDAIRKSIFNYGIPGKVIPLINKDIGNEITNTDLLLYLSSFLKQKINYLELGVSVGKNFIQVMNFLKNSSLMGFDIETVNPILEKYFKKENVIEWETSINSNKKTKSSISEYIYEANSNLVKYISGDILDENSWKQLNGQKFNIIYSDALHEPSALLYEFKMIKKYNLLNNSEFILMWDDLGGEMTISFMKIWSELKREYDLNKANIFLIKLRGWLGINEHSHTYGIIMKFEKNIF